MGVPMNSTVRFVHAFEAITSADGTSAATIRSAFDAILAGSWTPVEVAGFLVALRICGETSELIAAGVEALRAVMIPVDHGLPRVLDTCGTGGDGKGTLN